MRPKVDMNSPALRRMKTMKTLAGSGNACQKESDKTECVSGLTPNTIAKERRHVPASKSFGNPSKSENDSRLGRCEVRLELKVVGILRAGGGRGGGGCGEGRHVPRGDCRE